MTAEAILVNGLSASRLDWRRLRRLIMYGTIFSIGVACTTIYINGGIGALVLRADGYVTRESVSIAPAFEGRVVEVLVRPGDHVRQGQKIAVVQSIGLRRTLSELAAEKARLTSRIAELEARSRIVVEVLPAAQDTAQETAGYLGELKRAKAAGLALNKSLQQMSSASLDAIERSAKLRAEQNSLTAELDANRSALAEVALAYDALNSAYGDGALYAPLSGDVGSEIVSLGQMLSTGDRTIAKIYTGNRFVLAYLPESYVFDVEEGKSVGLRVQNEILNGKIERLLPIAGALPSEFQGSSRNWERGRMMRITLADATQLPVNQRVTVTNCFAKDCRVGFTRVAYDWAGGLVSQFAGDVRSFITGDVTLAQIPIPPVH
jgi:multidrug resistance efflux pump